MSNGFDAKHLRWALAALLALAGPLHAQTQVALTKHNLSGSGPGALHVTAPSGTCVFCHTPHNASATRALWNKSLPPTTYQLYTSSTTKATLNQPTGSSRLCLSCHDGIVALESLRAPPKGVTLTALGTITGRSLIGTNLSADHPISFLYNSALAAARGDLVDPLSLPASIHLDDGGQLQCTSCHDPHENRRPLFLRMDNTNGALCTACHKVPLWSGSSHAQSSATWNGLGTSPWTANAASTSSVAQNACLGCHRPHASGHAQRLLAQAGETDNCTVCHTATVARKDVGSEFLKPSHHPVEVNQWTHDPLESPTTMPRHVACADCHNPHAVNPTPAVVPAASGRLKGVASVSIAGLTIPDPNFEYEVCLKCHGLTEPTTTTFIARQDTTRNIRLRMQNTNPSFHPIAAIGLNATMLGLMPSYTTSSQITCTSCHNNDASTTAGTAPTGPHGSLFAPILERQYLSNDPEVESPQTYELCYKCHNEPFLVNDSAGTFHHKSHVVTDQAPCAVCHDPHGSRSSPHLIDFMLRDRTGKAVVTPSATLGLMQYMSTGPGHGTCYLQCHGSNHEPKSY